MRWKAVLPFYFHKEAALAAGFQVIFWLKKDLSIGSRFNSFKERGRIHSIQQQ